MDLLANLEDQERIKYLEKQLQDSQINTKRRHQQAFQLSCQLKEQNDQVANLAKLLKQEQHANHELSGQINKLNGALIAVNNLFNASIGNEIVIFDKDTDRDERTAQIPEGIKNEIIEMQSNPVSFFSKKINQLNNSTNYKLLKEAEKESAKWKSSFLSLVQKLKNGSLVRRSTRGANSNQKEFHPKSNRNSTQIWSDDAQSNNTLINEANIRPKKKSYADVVRTSKLIMPKNVSPNITSQSNYNCSTSSHNKEIEKQSINLDTVAEFFVAISANNPDLCSFKDHKQTINSANKVHHLRTSSRRVKLEFKPGANGKFSCQRCQAEFFSVICLIIHLRTKHK